MNKNKQFAFWRYDLFPYVLGGTVGSIKDGQVFITEYCGYFQEKQILKFTNLEYGQRLLKEIKQVKARYEQRKTELHTEFAATLPEWVN